MKMSTEEKKAELNKYCRKQMCTACPLVVTAFCQNNDASDEAVEEAYAVYLKRNTRSVKHEVKSS